MELNCTSIAGCKPTTQGKLAAVVQLYPWSASLPRTTRKPASCSRRIFRIIVRCVGGSKAPPVLHSSYRTHFERDCAVWRTARRRRPNLRFSKVWRAHQRVRQPGEPQDAFESCFNPLASAKIGRTLAQFLNGTVLYHRTARRGRPNLRFSKVWRTQQRVRQPGERQDAFATCFNPRASAKIGRSILTLAAKPSRLA